METPSSSSQSKSPKWKSKKPFVTFAVTWGWTSNETEGHIMLLPTKITIRGLSGNEIMVISARLELEPFDFSRFDEPLKYRLVYEWQNELDGEYTEHAKEFGMTQVEFFEFTTRLFDSVEKLLTTTLNSCAGPCYGFIGIRPFKVKKFLTALACLDMYPSVHTRYCVISPAEGLPRKNYRVVEDIRLYMDPTFHFIRPPMYNQWAAQGNYNPDEPVFFM